jgi:prophage tail gpP-like protein
MSRKHVVVKGDTLRDLSIEYYGTPYQWRRIFTASNFKSKDPDLIYPGEIAIIPDLASKIKQKLKPIKKINVDDPNQVTLLVNDRFYTGWNANSIKRSIDNCSDGFSIDFPWDPDDEQFRNDFKPFEYQEVRLYIGNDLILNGRLDVIKPVLDIEARELNVQGRTITAVLIDTSIETYPLQYRNQSLKQIAEAIIEPYGLGVSYEVEGAGTFKKVIADNGQTPFDFLNDLANKKGILISSTLEGELRFFRANANGKPVTSLIEGEGVFVGGAIAYNGVNRFSSYTAIAQSRGGKTSIKRTVKDDSIDVYRPKIFEASDTESGNVQDAASWERSTALADSIEDEIVSVKAPSLMICNETNFLIKDVEYTNDIDEGKVANLSLVLPQAFTLDFPKVFPWA